MLRGDWELIWWRAGKKKIQLGLCTFEQGVLRLVPLSHWILVLLRVENLQLAMRFNHVNKLERTQVLTLTSRYWPQKRKLAGWTWSQPYLLFCSLVGC